MAIVSPVKPGTPAAAAGKPAAPLSKDVPLDVPRHGNPRDGRPKIRVGASASFRYYARASSFGKTIADTFNLDRWDKRVIVWGLSRDRSLVLAAQSVPAWEDRENPKLHREYRDALDKIVDDARIVGKSDRAAVRGTALHLLSEQVDAGRDAQLAHLDEQTIRALNVWRRMMGMFRIIATETFVVHDGWQAAGSFDRLVELLVEVTIRDGNGNVLAVLPAGTVLIVDLKTGRTSDYYGVEYAAQLAVYAGGVPYVHLDDATAAAGDDGRRPWPGGVAPNQDWALIPHVPVDKPEEAGLVWVDLRVGRQCGDLVGPVKAARKAAEGAFVDGTVVDMPGAPAPLPLPSERAAARIDEMNEGLIEVLVELIRAAESVEAIGALYAQHAEDWTDALTAEADHRCAALGVVSATSVQPAPVEVPAPAEPVDVERVPQYRIDDMLRTATTAGEVYAIYERHAARWSDYLGKVADARLDHLAQQVSA